MFGQWTTKRRMILSYVVILIFFVTSGYLGIKFSEETIERGIRDDSTSFAHHILGEIDKTVFFRIEEVQNYSETLYIKESIEQSNFEFEQLENIDAFILEKDMEWVSAPKDNPTPFMQEIIERKTSNDLRKRIEFYNKKYSYEIFSEIFIVNKYGAIAATTGRTSDYFQADEYWYQEAVKKGDFWVSDIKYDESSETYANEIVINLYDDNGEFIGLLKAILSTDEIVNNLKEIIEDSTANSDHGFAWGRSFSTTKLSLFTKDGKIIYSTDKYYFLEEFCDESGSFSEYLDLVESDTEELCFTVSEYKIKGKKERLFVYANSTGYRNYSGQDWILTIEHEASEAYKPVTELKILMSIIFIIVALFSFFITFFVSQSIPKLVKEAERLSMVTKKNLKKIIPILRKVALGDLQQKINISEKKDEFTAVLVALDLMIEDLRGVRRENANLVTNLESRVKERTGQLEISKAKAEAILASIGEGVYVLDSNKKIISFNAAAEKITGWKFREVVGKKCKVLGITNDDGTQDLSDIICGQGKSIGKNKTVSTDGETFYTTKNRKRVPIRSYVSEVKNSRGKKIGSIIVFHDITKEYKIDKMKSEFVSIASHQLRTPLTGIKWFIELMKKGKVAGKLNKKQSNMLDKVSFSNERMIHLVNDLLDVSHIETGRKFYIEPKLIDVVPIIESVIADHVNMIKTKKIQFSFKTPKIWKWLVDEEKIRQVLQNIISNAIKYSKENGIIEIGAKRSRKKEIIFYVKDRGLGIPKHQQNKVFEKFFRADNIVSIISEGTGLGLYIAKAIVEAHGGRIWFTSKEKVGTTFYFSLPI